MSDPLIGEIRMFAGNFAPQGWAFCDGQLLPVAQNAALFSLLGTTYGGDGRTTFALPDLRGRVPVHPGQGPGLSQRRLGEKGGQESVTLSEAQIPAHVHKALGTNDQATFNEPENALLARGRSYENNPTSEVAMHPDTISSTGGGQDHDNLQPYLCINFIIALQGLFPSRS
jgi:microcystin-dependent protein